MSEPFLDLLKRFTPEAHLDRDALFYAAGRASLPSPRRWMILTAVLALGQTLTLLLLLVRPVPSFPQPHSPLAPPSAPAPVESEPRTPGRQLVLEPAPASGPLVPDAPPIPALSALYRSPLE